MVSGIGPHSTLEAHNIPIMADRPGVGQNMMDHPLFGAQYAVNVVTHSRLANDPTFAVNAVNEYNTNRTGILTSTAAEILSFQNLNPGMVSQTTLIDLHDMYGDDWPHIELLAVDGAYLVDASDQRNYVTILAGLQTPFSRGTVTIASNDTTENPVINPNWLLDSRDGEMAVAALRRAREVFNTSSTRPVVVPGVNGEREAFPGDSVQSDEALLAAIRRTATTTDHASCTCRMGREDDTMAVVDPSARVYGVDGLRVVDASALVVLLPGHPIGTVYAFAEKIVAEILGGR